MLRSLVLLRLLILHVPVAAAATNKTERSPSAKRPGSNAPVSCDSLVECANHTAPPLANRPVHLPGRTCPGVPECSGHGKCKGYDNDGTPRCDCAAGFFGRDCSHKTHDCAALRSCADCQNPANTKFCGWCAGGRYCVPKHVHKGLARRGKACKTWHEDSCPDSGGMLAEYELGDDTSVALAEALVAMIDGAGGEGTSMRLGLSLVLVGLAVMAVCARRERRAAERRRRFEAFMAEEQGMLHAAEPATPITFTGGRRQLGPSADESRGAAAERSGALRTHGLNSSAMADALGMAAAPKPPPGTAPAGGAGGGQGGRESGGVVDEAEEDERMHAAVREAVRQDIEERKAQRRAATEEAREKALAEEQARAEREAIEQLKGETHHALRQAHAAPPDSIEAARPPAAAWIGSPHASSHADAPTAATPAPHAAPAATTPVPLIPPTPETQPPKKHPPRAERPTPAPATATAPAPAPAPARAPAPALAPAPAPAADVGLDDAEAEFLAALDDL